MEFASDERGIKTEIGIGSPLGVNGTVGMADYIENFYNMARRHSALNYLTPIEFEDLHSTHIHQAALS